MNETSYTHEFTCCNCGEKRKITALTSEWNRFLNPVNQELIQNIFPRMSDDDREMLITRICGKCFDQLFKDTEE